MTKHHESVRETRTHAVASLREAKARLEAMIAESKEDDEKRKLYFGYFETSQGDL